MSAESMMRWLPRAQPDWADLYSQAEQSVLAGSPRPEVLAPMLTRLARVQLPAREQLKLGRLAKRVLALPESESPLRRVRVGFTGNRNLAFLSGAMAAAGLGRGLLIEAVEAPYGTLQPVAHRTSEFFGGRLDALVAVFDEQALRAPDSLLGKGSSDTAVAQGRELLERLAETATSYGAPLLVATVPENGDMMSSADWAMPGSMFRLRRHLNDVISEGAADRRWVLWDMAELAGRIGLAQWSDPARFHLTKAPFRLELAHMAADHLCAVLAAQFGKGARAIVLDLDNTLWGGVIGDDGLAGIRVGQGSAEGEAYAAFQRFLLKVRERGLVLTASSKNNDDIAREPFRDHPDMVLKEHHFAVFQANWNDKATNVAKIAQALKLGQDALVFIDDNPAERARVRQELPMVMVPEIGEDPAQYIDHLTSSRLFEQLPPTAEDLKRVDSYGQVARQVELTEKLGNYDAYLQSLSMTLTVSAFDEVGLPRIVQLINKSNQFNLTTRRYSSPDVQAMIQDPDVFTIQARLADTYSDHGMIAVMICRRSGDDLMIDTWLQSCRVLERGVEAALMNHLMSLISKAGAKRLVGEYIPTARNDLVAEVFDTLGFERLSENEGRRLYAAAPCAWVDLPHHIRLVQA